MRRGSARQPALSTRDRILHAAILRFSSHSYEETGLRDIAADARAVGPTIAGLQPTTQRITRGEAIETQIEVFSGKYLLFFGLLSTALLALVTLPPLLASEGWDFWSICGAVLFGACAAYWFALYIAKRRRSAA